MVRQREKESLFLVYIFRVLLTLHAVQFSELSSLKLPEGQALHRSAPTFDNSEELDPSAASIVVDTKNPAAKYAPTLVRNGSRIVSK